MSKKRSISKKVNLTNFPLPETSNILPNTNAYSSEPCIQEIYFGERIKSSGSSTFSKSSDVFTSDDGLRDLLSYKSSGSSTSGSEDIEIEATRKVTEEFEKLDKILYGETVCNGKEVNEYEQWTCNFPHLRIIGSAMKIHPSTEECTEEFYEEIIAEHSDGDHCNISEETPINTKRKIKEAVIKNVLKEVKTKLLNKSQEPSKIYPMRDISLPKRRDRKLSENSSSVKESDNNEISEPFLQATTISLQHSSPFHKPNFEYQNPIMKSHLSASKWQKEDSSSEYSSLPHISNYSVPYSSKGCKKNSPLSANKPERCLHNSSANSRLKSSTSKSLSKFINSPREKCVVLPPIQNLCIDEGRSISSTPSKFHSRPVSNKYQKYFVEK